MKKVLVISLFILFITTSCSPNTALPESKPSAWENQSESATNTVTAQISPTPQDWATAEVTPSNIQNTLSPTDKITVPPTQAPTEIPTKTPSSQEVLAEFYQNGYNTNTLIGIDMFGRTFDIRFGTRENKQVGIFYWPWFTEGGEEKIYDNTKILAMENGLNILTSPDLPDKKASPANAVHWWGEPLFGYYSSKDKWVARRHLRMLELAGVDYICLDCTNAVPFTGEINMLLECIDELQKEGFNPPRLTVYTHYMSINTLRTIYNSVHLRNRFPNAWYQYDGKPMVIAYDNVADDKKATGADGYNPEPLSQKILDYFTFVRPEWPNEYKTYSDSIAWCEWKYPVPLHKKFNSMTVSPAAHPGCPFSFSLTGKSTNWGRGWDPITYKNNSQDALKGTFFQKNWETVINQDPDMVYIGGWNEWTMSKFMYGGQYVLVDNVNFEYSRDIEPMKGGAQDSFYMQMITNIRKYKNKSITTALQNAKFNPVTPDASFDWSKVQAVFRKTEAVDEARDNMGAAKSVYYKQDEARNNIKEIRIVTDKDNIYFHITCADTITHRKDAGWMNLFIGTGSLSQKGWEGYEFVVNRSGEGNVDSLNADFSLKTAGKAGISKNGNTMVITVPRKVLGLSQTDNNFYFKVADNIENPSDITDYYVSGCSVPMGRMSFRYVG